MTMFYLSFADRGKPKGSQWLGGCYVEADDFIMAVRVAHAIGCNPGGEVVGREVFLSVRPNYVCRLLNREEINDAIATSHGSSN